MTDVETEINNLNTGDILLFSSKTCWYSRLIEYFTKSQWSHVGMVLRDPVYLDSKLQGLYLWESGAEDFNDAEDNKAKWGIQIVDLKKKITEYDGTISVRKIININNLTEDINARDNKLEVIHNTTYNKSYDYNPLDMLYCLLQLQKMHIRDLNRMFCSAFIAYIYTELGYINQHTNWSMIEPCHFSSDHTPVFNIEKYSVNDNDWQIISVKEGLTFINGFTLQIESKIK